MFVERLSWTVPRDLNESALELLQQMHQDMAESGGLIRALSGKDSQAELLSLTFWKSWEDLARYLASNNSSRLDALIVSHKVEHTRHQHLESIWQCHEFGADHTPSTSNWLLCDFAVRAEAVEALLDCLRYFARGLTSEPGFVDAGLWIDRNHPGNVVMALDWRNQSVFEPEKLNLAAANAAERLGISAQQMRIFTMKVTDVRQSRSADVFSQRR